MEVFVTVMNAINHLASGDVCVPDVRGGLVYRSFTWYSGPQIQRHGKMSDRKGR